MAPCSRRASRRWSTRARRPRSKVRKCWPRASSSTGVPIVSRARPAPAKPKYRRPPPKLRGLASPTVARCRGREANGLVEVYAVGRKVPQLLTLAEHITAVLSPELGPNTADVVARHLCAKFGVETDEKDPA